MTIEIFPFKNGDITITYSSLNYTLEEAIKKLYDEVVFDERD